MDHEFVSSGRFKVGDDEDNSDEDVAEFEFGKAPPPIQVTLLEDESNSKPAPPLSKGDPRDAHRKEEKHHKHHELSKKHRHQKDKSAEKSRHKHKHSHKDSSESSVEEKSRHRHGHRDKSAESSESSDKSRHKHKEKRASSVSSELSKGEQVPRFIKQCMSEYGEPSLVHVKKECSFLLWDKYDLKDSGLTQVVVKSCGVQHGSHTDHVWTTIEHELSEEKVFRVLKLSDALSYDRVTHELTSRSESCYMNAAILYSAIKYARDEEKSDALLKRVEKLEQGGSTAAANDGHYLRQLQKTLRQK